MRRSAWLVLAMLAVSAPAAGQQRPPDGGSVPAKRSAVPKSVLPAVPAPAPAKAPVKAEKPKKKAPEPKRKDQAVIEHLDLLLLLDLLSDYELFDEGEPAKDPPATPDGGATFHAPGGSREYRP